MTWEKEIEGFRTYLKVEKGLSDNSIHAYVTDLQKLVVYLREKGMNIGPDQVVLANLKTMMQEITDRGISPRTQARIISGIKSFYKYLLIEEKVEKDPTALLEAPRVGRKLPEVLTVEEIDSIINTIDVKKSEGQRNKAILETLYSCGLRVSELIDLKISNLFFESGFVKIEGKGSKERLVPISTKAIKEINLYLSDYRRTLKIDPADEDILFLNRRGKKLSRVMIFTIIKTLVAKVGLTKNISPHTFRHSFATHLIDGGANLRAVQEMLGHESIITTEIYTHLDKEYLKNTIVQYHPRS
ncbi:integrase/recombinase XerD [Breznakibacter xylanolyticus]|uniref:Tyrosine recombinase XerC n=1 Tax=Breznakibacter xylanolyticus TaxID=990 RepID=A0A2W7Q852_9BACT|nr:site-specific tyrosine recombinase XerD [Breznakibacter xylanolyticus]MBN2743442.1 site-specific tyrosine recombinase XerD [Marinilabiliaceae bacterium]PZX17929.1 integrase/recombinase XerD [Breznakibacter xylanolyticus]